MINGEQAPSRPSRDDKTFQHKTWYAGQKAGLPQLRNAPVVHPSRTPTLHDVLAKLKSYPAISRKKDWLLSTERAIHVLCYGGISDVFNTTTPLSVSDILAHNVVFELDTLSESEAIFFVEILMSAIVGKPKQPIVTSTFTSDHFYILLLFS